MIGAAAEKLREPRRTRKSRYRYDDRAMRPICECPENCRPM